MTKAVEQYEFQPKNKFEMVTVLRIDAMKSDTIVRKTASKWYAYTEDNGISDAKVDEDPLNVERECLQSMLAGLESIGVNCIVVLNTSPYGAATWQKY